MSSFDELYETYVKDPRTPCNYGVKCYQKNQIHRDKYKHPPPDDRKGKNGTRSKPKKRTRLDRRNEEKDEPSITESDCDSEVPEITSKKCCVSLDSSDQTASAGQSSSKQRESDVGSEDEQKSDIVSHSRNETEDNETESSNLVDEKEFIKEKFLVHMPSDFYSFYELCKEISPNDPCSAFKAADLLLVGPYDVLNGKLLDAKVENNDLYLRHWRYFYDPPEFQTIIKGNDKEGLHFGYWRDEPKENPIFVAKNSMKVDCKIKPIAETVFGAVDDYLEEKLKTTNPFAKPKVASLRQRLKKFANARCIRLEKSTETMRARERLVVARTFHRAGIVVPYNKKTQLGYRELAATDGNLKKILKQIDESENDAERSDHLINLEEVERLATIAADECDFGTCLELGHDLFSSGSEYVQTIAVRMLTTAYSLLNRPEFLKIVKAHCCDRKTGCVLGII
ncbi:histone PARylation factor 1 [Neodiprion fabricii]|uniref:histone PARylation factor 1 n=1 Tax=Neodiprion fabricii TaxID=2872261 RepID=UPI001ED95DED|nr:histone PARylation factor 1 [Neodiprion fabricii]XP_046431623.1 histone PARylation factor 1 [Neodiprion fabricii]